MKFIYGLLLVFVLATAPLHASAAIVVSPGVGYANGVVSDDAVLNCGLEKSITTGLIAKAGNAASLAPNSLPQLGFGLSLEIIRLRLKSSPKESEYAAVVRADVKYDGKLVGTHDFDSDESFKNGQECEALQALGSSLGESAAEWAMQTRFAECREGCAGIHPDETIVVGADVLLSEAGAISDTVRDDCAWTSSMVKKIVKAFNDTELPPRAKLESRSLDIVAYPGRRLVLYADSVHAVGGGGISGPKWMAMHGELREGPSLIASFESYDNSGRGLTTCRSVDALSEGTVEKIVEWLRNPSLGAKLK
ncbi:MAG: hypothetical protein JWN23_1151 [Rhodocyclales bacterium]|nr:hypothetical protein [Rhodocyclales bacterium]